MAQTKPTRTMSSAQLMVTAFVIAVPLGVALGFAGMAVLPPALSERLFLAFMVLIVLGSLGLLLFAPRKKPERNGTADIASLGANVVRLDSFVRRTPHRAPLAPGHQTASVAPLRRARK